MTERALCPRCGVPLLSSSSTAELCPRCVLEVAAHARDEAPVESSAEMVFTGPGSTRPTSPEVEELAPHFPGHRIEERIGEGGMGAVYRAVQTGLDRPVALKILHAEIAAQPGFAERFEREARTLARLRHPNIVGVHDFGRSGPWYYLALEHVDGVDLRQMLRARTVGAREALSLVMQICDALQYAHDAGVVHRDIKPENILVDRQGQVRILDFGLAKVLGRQETRHLTHTHQVMGTPHYMAPEQWEKPQAVDHRADIFALGVVFYELLTGELPVGRFDPPSKRVEVDVRLDEVVLRTLERAPDRRYQKASEVRDDVHSLSADAPPDRPAPDRPADDRPADDTERPLDLVAWLRPSDDDDLLPPPTASDADREETSSRFSGPVVGVVVLFVLLNLISLFVFLRMLRGF